MTNHPNRSRRVLIQRVGGYYKVGDKRGVVSFTTVAHAGHCAYWLIGDGDRMRREAMIEGTGTYSWSLNPEEIDSDFARYTKGTFVDDLELEMQNRWGLSPEQIRTR